MSLNCLRGIILLLFVAHMGFAGASGWRIHPKPSSPVTVVIEPQQQYQSGVATDFIVKASSKIDAENFVITVQPPPGTIVNEGNLTWNGVIKKGEVKSLVFTLSFPQNESLHLSATASINGPGQGKFGARTVWNAPSKTMALKAKQSNVQKRRSVRNGRGIVEFSIK